MSYIAHTLFTIIEKYPSSDVTHKAGALSSAFFLQDAKENGGEKGTVVNELIETEKNPSVDVINDDISLDASIIATA